MAEGTLETGVTDNKNAANAAKVVSMTEEELQLKLQAETDKRVSQALKTTKQKWEEEYKAKLENERAESDRLAKLSAQEREKELLERSKKELTDKENIILAREMKLTAIDVLAKEGLPVTFADQLIGKNADETHERIKNFKVEWLKEIDKEVNKRLKTTPPMGGSGGKQGEQNINDIIRQMARQKR